ncbi:MAG: hypothetical protein U0670_01355 [Anaerolineae bacterium]
MADLFKKLNVLVKASLNELLSSERARSSPSGSEQPASSRPTLTPDRLGNDIDRQLAAMRLRVADAQAYEGKLQAQIDALDAEIKHLDAVADTAVASGDDVNARFAIADMRTAEQRQMKLMNDLRDHQIAAQELVDRIDQMAAMVAQAREQAQANTSSEPNPQTQASHAVPNLADVLRRAQETATNEAAANAVDQDLTNSSKQSEAASASSINTPVEDDLERRRQRLSKKD